MAFSDCFGSCLSPLPTPGQFLDSASELLDFLHQLHTAAESSGLTEEVTLPALVAAGALTGVDEALLAAFAEAAGITVAAYITACAGCAASCAGSSIWDAITATNDSYVQDKVTVAANDAGIPKTADVA